MLPKPRPLSPKAISDAYRHERGLALGADPTELTELGIEVNFPAAVSRYFEEFHKRAAAVPQPKRSVPNTRGGRSYPEESGRDMALKHDAAEGPAQPPFDAAVNAAGAAAVRAEIVHVVETPHKLSKANSKARRDLLELQRNNGLAFIPSTNKEKTTLRSMLHGAPATLINTNLGARHIDGVKSGLYKRANTAKKPKEVAHNEAEKSERSILNEWVDYLENAREVFVALKVVRNILNSDSGKYKRQNVENPLLSLMTDAFATNNLDLQAKVWVAVAAMVQFRDITRMRDDEVEPAFEPLRTKENKELARPDANKRIIDVYTAPAATTDEMADYIIEEAQKLSITEAGLLLEGTLANQYYRGTFWRKQAEANLDKNDPLLDIVKKQKKVQ